MRTSLPGARRTRIRALPRVETPAPDSTSCPRRPNVGAHLEAEHVAVEAQRQKGAVGAISEIVVEHLHADGPAHLAELAPTISELMLALFGVDRGILAAKSEEVPTTRRSQAGQSGWRRTA
jgi:hypothetical protein